MIHIILLLVAAIMSVRAQNSSSTILRTCPSQGLCYSLNIPDSTAQTGTGSIYYQITASTKHVWVALAQGTQMAGASMYIVYQSADGTNVTVSPRTASGEVMPQEQHNVQLTLLEGSGVSNGMMTANIRCDNCTSWASGTLDFHAKNSDWLYAAAPGSPLQSDDLDAVIPQHDPHGTFTFATQQAIGGPNSNPFLANASSNNSSNSSSDVTTVTGTASTGASGFESLSAATQNRFILVHGSLATIAFVALFPLGALLMRAPRLDKSRIGAHASVQLLAYIVFIVAAGFGIYIAKDTARLSNPHAVIGLLLLSVIFFMPFFGHLHHSLYKRHGKRTLVGHLHAITGRVSIILGIINGGLGLRLAGVARTSMVAYIVIASIVGAAYIALFIFVELKRAPASSTMPTHGNDVTKNGE